MQKNPEKRLGCGPDGLEDIKRHPWFRGLDWDLLAAKKGTPPFVPDVRSFLIRLSCLLSVICRPRV